MTQALIIEDGSVNKSKLSLMGKLESTPALQTLREIKVSLSKTHVPKSKEGKSLDFHWVLLRY